MWLSLAAYYKIKRIYSSIFTRIIITVENIISHKYCVFSHFTGFVCIIFQVCSVKHYFFYFSWSKVIKHLSMKHSIKRMLLHCAGAKTMLLWTKNLIEALIFMQYGCQCKQALSKNGVCVTHYIGQIVKHCGREQMP